MKVTGIIAEYDPFHNGHRYHMEKARELTGADAVVVIMSGHFTQRGMPAFFRRDARVRMAVDGGADLVIELPYIYACNSSHEFARGAAGILNGLGCIDTLVFGAETDDMNALETAARAGAEADAEMSLYIKEEMKRGISYPEALTRSVERKYGEEAAAVLREPNNLLGIEYMKALYALDSVIKPLAVGRKAAAHGEVLYDRALDDNAPEGAPVPEEGSSHIASGTAVRRAVYDGGARACERLIPEASLRVLLNEEAYIKSILRPDVTGTYNAENCFAVMRDTVKKNMFELLKYRIITADESELANIYGVGEGLENRLKGCIGSANDLDGLIDAVKSKRYTRVRISRMMMHIMVNLMKVDFEEMRGSLHARVLGFSPVGGKLLREISETAAIPVVSNFNRLDRRSPEAARVLGYDMRASDVYAMLCGSGDAPGRERKFIPYSGRKICKD